MRPNFALIIGLSFATIAVLNGCVPYWQGKETEAEILALQWSTIWSKLTVNKKASLKKKLPSFSIRLDTMSKRLSELVVSLRTNSANSGSHIDEMRHWFSNCRVSLRNCAIVCPRPVLGLQVWASTRSPLPEDKRALFNFGARAFETANCVDAIQALRSFCNAVPKGSTLIMH